MTIDLTAERDQAMAAFTQISQQIQQCEQQLGALHGQLEQQRGLLMWLDSKLRPEQQQEAAQPVAPANA